MKKGLRVRYQFLEMFVLLLENGFSIQESLHVMIRSQSFSQELLTIMTEALSTGKSLAECFDLMGFTTQEVMQIQLAEVHGNLVEALQNISQQLTIMNQQTAELKKIISYPIVLLVFSSGMLLSMRYILLPQLLASDMVQADHWGIWVMRYSPIILGIGLLGMILVALIIQWYFKRKSILAKARFISRLPFVGSFYTLYQTSYFSLEWGKLFKEGFEMKQILSILVLLPNQTLMVALAQEINQGLQEGILLTDQLSHYSFLTPEFSLIVFQGEIKGRLGDELLIYQQLLMKKIVAKMEQTIRLIQPIVFVLIAVVIVAIYVAMFLPIYGNIGGMLE
ncbi:competence type IV pilus assembly protein ComGB [Enterococcus aquimarinus]|nr:competence type IV pilus assembly protein ComGB [Enterococcus aquimarinus]